MVSIFYFFLVFINNFNGFGIPVKIVCIQAFVLDDTAVNCNGAVYFLHIKVIINLNFKVFSKGVKDILKIFIRINDNLLVILAFVFFFKGVIFFIY